MDIGQGKKTLQRLCQSGWGNFYTFYLACGYKGSLAKKMRCLKILNLLRKKGVVFWRLKIVAYEYTDDYYSNKDLNEEEKFFFICKGIAPYKVKWYGITKENYKNYISDFDFYQLSNYFDASFTQLFEHKLNTYYLLGNIKDNMPKHYWYIDIKGNMIPLAVDKDHYGSVEDIIAILHKETLAVKACKGGHGRGFIKLEYLDGKYMINSKEANRKEVEKLILKLKDYIITEFSTPHAIIRMFCGEDAFAVLRIITIFDDFDGPQVTSAMLRLGSKEGGIVSDYHGTIYCGIGLEDGKSFKPIWRESDFQYCPCPTHPDTGKDLEELVIPKWDELRELALTISRNLAWAPYLVMDIIPTDNGFKLLEINSHGQPRNLEAQYPFCLNKYQKKAFRIN